MIGQWAYELLMSFWKNYCCTWSDLNRIRKETIKSQFDWLVNSCKKNVSRSKQLSTWMHLENTLIFQKKLKLAWKWGFITLWLGIFNSWIELNEYNMKNHSDQGGWCYQWITSLEICIILHIIYMKEEFNDKILFYHSFKIFPSS